MKIDQKTFETPSGKKLDIHLMSSLYHVEINPRQVSHMHSLFLSLVHSHLPYSIFCSMNVCFSFEIAMLGFMTV